MKTLRFALLLGVGISLLIAGSLLVVAQDDHDDDHSDTDHELVEHGYEIFTVNGCVACHGQNAEGNDVGPALAGHSEFAIRRQVRAPTSIMLPFSPVQIPAEDLEALVAYIGSLEVESEGEHGHDEHDMGGITIGDLIFAHHWFLWLELEMADVDGSIHHTAHSLELLIDGPHKVMMQSVLTALGEGDLETSRNLIEPMITDVGEFSHDIYTVGMQFTYEAIISGDHETALHFATDLSEHDLSDDQLDFVTSVLELVEACQLDDAMLSIDMALEGNIYFIPNDMDMGDEEMHMDDDHSGDDDMDDDHGEEMDSDDHDEDDDHGEEMGSDDHDEDDMDDDHDEEIDDDHDEMGTDCGEHDEEVESSTDNHSD